MSPPGFLDNDDTLTDFLESFERGTWPKSVWNHAAHLAVAACHLVEYPDEDVAGHMRRGIVHYNHLRRHRQQRSQRLSRKSWIAPDLKPLTPGT